jgi:hypothetical protein
MIQEAMPGLYAFWKPAEAPGNEGSG